MATKTETGMDKGEIKRLLARSKREPVSCAVGIGPDPGVALLLMDKVKNPKAVLKQLEKNEPDIKSTRFGTVLVDVDDDPKLVRFVLNKPLPSIARKLVKTLKGTGFSKVAIGHDDGSPVEGAADEEDEEEPATAAADAGSRAGEAGQAPSLRATPPASPATDTPGTTDAGAPKQQGAAPGPAAEDMAPLVSRATTLVRRIAQMTPEVTATLRPLAESAQAAIRSGDPTAATAAVDALETALDTAADGASATARDAQAGSPEVQEPDKPASDGDDATRTAQVLPDGAVATVRKARTAWGATRRKMQSDLDSVRQAVLDAYRDHPVLESLEKTLDDKIGPVLGRLDDALSDKLDELSAVTDAAAATRLAGEAQQILRGYQEYIAGEPLIAALDSNPLTPVSLQKSLTATLVVLSKSVRAMTASLR